MNASQHFPVSSNGTVESVLISAVFSFIFVAGTVGNSLVLAVVLRGGRASAKITSVFIVNLCAADLGFIVLCVPVQAAVYTLPEWRFGSLACRTAHFAVYLTMHASALTLTAVSLDRYLAIRYPLRAREMRTPRNALICIGVVWAVSLVLSSPYLSYYQQMDLDGTTVCIPAWDYQQRRAMDVCTFVFGYLIPVLVLSLTYARTIRYLWTSVDPVQDASECRRAKRRVTKMIIIVAVLFCLCWLPHHLVILCMWFGHFPLNHTTYVLRILSHLVAYTNSCLNPIVYALVSKHFRKGFRKVFGCVGKKRPVQRVHAAPPAQTVSLVEVGSSEGSNQSEGLGRARLWSRSSRKMMSSTFMTFNVT
ncbi:galanin receptor type 2 [Astyanax mexicanus]|uniref:Galanin receptor type 2 n=1 Tax=Astyanax mexicanus TaxID=7994 RepID=A0A8B9JFI6_ASTMX|nr:galanin receptor type 2 [Astyanax mexicanus]